MAATAKVIEIGGSHALRGATSGVDLRRNPLVEEARDIYLAALAGEERLAIAINAAHLMSYGIGSMIAKLELGGKIGNGEAVFDQMALVFTVRAMTADQPLRFNRRTVLDFLEKQQIIPENLSPKDAKPAGTTPNVSEVARVVENHTLINLEQIRSSCRQHPIVRARFLAIWAMRHVCGHSLTLIGEQLGNRDHTSVLNGVNRVRAMREDAGERRIIDAICDEADALALRRHYNVLTSQSLPRV